MHTGSKDDASSTIFPSRPAKMPSQEKNASIAPQQQTHKTEAQERVGGKERETRSVATEAREGERARERERTCDQGRPVISRLPRLNLQGITSLHSIGWE